MSTIKYSLVSLWKQQKILEYLILFKIKQESGPDATPTVSTTNCDFRNL